MKLKKHIFLLMFLLLYPYSSNSIAKYSDVSCENSSSVHSLLIGSWENENSERKIIYKYSMNNKYTGYIQYKGKNELWKFSATWKLNNNVISYVYDYMKLKGSEENFAKGTLDSDFVILVNCKELVIQSKDGNKEKYFRKGA